MTALLRCKMKTTYSGETESRDRETDREKVSRESQSLAELSKRGVRFAGAGCLMWRSRDWGGAGGRFSDD